MSAEKLVAGRKRTAQQKDLESFMSEEAFMELDRKKKRRLAAINSDLKSQQGTRRHTMM